MYGLIGYLGIRVYLSGDERTLDGFTWGAGLELKFGEWILGGRLTNADYDGSDVQVITMTIGHKLSF